MKSAADAPVSAPFNPRDAQIAGQACRVVP